MSVSSVVVQRKTGASTWETLGTVNNPTSTYSVSNTFTAGVHAVKAIATDAASNTTETSIIVFESASTRKAIITKATDDVNNFTGDLNNMSHTNDTVPVFTGYVEAGDLTINGSTATMRIESVTGVKLWIAWKPYAETKATIDYAQDAIGTHATVGGIGQMVATVTTGFVKNLDKITFTYTPAAFLPNRTYTIGCKWLDSNSIASTVNASNEFSLVIDTKEPVVSITSPVNGYVFNGQVTAVSGAVSDTLI